MSGTIAERAVELSGIRLGYQEVGQGKPVVFLHGAGGAPPHGVSFVAMLGEHHRLVLPSRPGFDETPIGHCQALRDVVDVIAEFVKTIAGGKAHVVAQSLGGAVGCWLAILYPELVESLVLSAPSAFAKRHTPAGGQMPTPEEIEKRLYGDNPSWDAPPTEQERLRIARNARENMARFAAPDGNSELRARLREIKAPTLLICSTNDAIVPEEALQPYQQEIPSCTRIFIYGAAHEMPVSAAPRWVRLVSDFVDRGEYFVVNMG